MASIRLISLILTVIIIVPLLFLPNSVGFYIRDPKDTVSTKDTQTPILWFFNQRTFSHLMLFVIEGFYYFFIITNLCPSIFLIIWSSLAKWRDRHPVKDDKEGERGRALGNRFRGKRLRRSFALSRSDRDALPMGLKREGEFPIIKRVNLFENDPYPLISLIIPCYNEEQNVAAAIENAYLQDYIGKIEIIVVDDGSRDNTRAISGILADKGIKREVVTFTKPNGGKASALNHGILHSHGKIIVTTDGDSHLDAQCVSKIVDGFRKNPFAGTVGGFVLIRNTHKGYLVKLQQIEYILTQHVIRIPQSEMGNVLIEPGPVFGIRADVARRYPSQTRTCVEDVDLTQTVLGCGYQTRTALDAISLTEAPTTWRSWFNQRKRWIYGQYQSWRENKHFLKKNPWGIYMYFTWLSTFITFCILLAMVCLTVILLPMLYINQYLFVFISARTLLIVIIYLITKIIILYQYKEGRSVIGYLPFKIAYDLIASLLAAILYYKFITGRGVKIKWGGRSIRLY